MEYTLKVKIDQIVTKEVRLLVVAASEDEAIEKSREALMIYPEPIETKGIRRIQTVNSRYWIPRDIDVVSIKEGDISD